MSELRELYKLRDLLSELNHREKLNRERDERLYANANSSKEAKAITAIENSEGISMIFVFSLFNILITVLMFVIVARYNLLEMPNNIGEGLSFTLFSISSSFLILSIVLKLIDNVAYSSNFGLFVDPALKYCIVITILSTVATWVLCFKFNIISGPTWFVIALTLLSPVWGAVLTIISPLTLLAFGTLLSYNLLTGLLICAVSAIFVGIIDNIIGFIFRVIFNSKSHKNKVKKAYVAYRNKVKEIDQQMSDCGDEEQDVYELYDMIDDIDVVHKDDKNEPMVNSLINCIEQRYANNIVQAKCWMEKNRQDIAVRKEIEAARRELEKANKNLDAIGVSMHRNHEELLKSISDSDHFHYILSR